MSQIIGDPTPMFAAGGAVCCCGFLGLASVLLPYLLMVPLEVWGYILMVLVGAGLMLADRLEQILSQGCMHERIWTVMQYQMQVGQRIALLYALREPNLGDMQVILADVSPTAAAILGARSLRTVARAFQMRLMGISPLAGPAALRSQAGTSRHLASAMSWLRRKQLSLGYDDQVRLYGLAQQASTGDCQLRPLSPCTAGPFARAKRKSWEAQRGLPRAEATRQLCEVLLEVDPAFRAAHPKIAQAQMPARMPIWGSEPTPVKNLLRCLCELAERRVPTDLDERLVLAKRRLLVGTVLVAALMRLLRSSQGLEALKKRVRTMRLGKMAGPAALAYLVVLNLGLPPTLHALLPRVLRELPKNVETFMQHYIDGPAPRLCRYAVQAVTPPVAGSPFRE